MADKSKKYFARNWRGNGLKFVAGQACPPEVEKYLGDIGEAGAVLTGKRPGLDKLEKKAVMPEGKVEKK
jgi:hypothetical protein